MTLTVVWHNREFWGWGIEFGALSWNNVKRDNEAMITISYSTYQKRYKVSGMGLKRVFVNTCREMFVQRCPGGNWMNPPSSTCIRHIWACHLVKLPHTNALFTVQNGRDYIQARDCIFFFCLNYFQATKLLTLLWIRCSY